MATASVEGDSRVEWVKSGSTDFALSYLGHAGFLVQAGGVRLVIDPWFHSAFLRSWFPWPNNSHLLPVLDGGCDFLYISHHHEDHLDRRVLERLPRDTAVLCPNFRSKSLKRVFRHLGFTNLIELGHLDSIDLADGCRATMVLDTSHKEDSALLVEAEGIRFLDLNDCHPRLDEIPRGIDLLAAQYSGAMWYPNCYDYPAAVMASKVQEIRANLLETLISTCEASEARSYLPSAGPPCFLDPVLEQYNRRESTIFPHWPDVSAAFRSALPHVGVVEMEPGDQAIFDAESWKVLTLGGEPPESLVTYRARRRSEWHTPVDLHTTRSVTTDELATYFNLLVRKNKQLLEGFSAQLRIGTDEHAWDVSIAEGKCSVVEANHATVPRYEFRMPGWVLREIVDRRTTWEEALLSLRIELRRDPDLFDMTLFGLLRYGEQPVQTQRMVLDTRGSGESIERGGFCFQRYCPHAGEDLSTAQLVGTRIECPRHHWSWDLTTGQCVAGGMTPLRVEPAGL